MLQVIVALRYLFILVVLRTLLRSDRLALGAAVLVSGLIGADPSVGGSTWIGTVIVFVTSAFTFIVLTRAGLVALIVMQLVSILFVSAPITFDTSAWYSGIGFAVLTIVAALTLYGFRTSLGSRRLFEPEV
jgi:hypothetical protein